jgi:hypothetical protein
MLQAFRIYAKDNLEKMAFNMLQIYICSILMNSQILSVAMAKQKAPDARRGVCRGMRRTYEYVAVTRLERNAADGLFAKPSILIR